MGERVPVTGIGHSIHVSLPGSFLIGDDGRVYEGVGWNIQGLHTQGYNNVSLGLAFFGTKEGNSPHPGPSAGELSILSSFAPSSPHSSLFFLFFLKKFFIEFI